MKNLVWVMLFAVCMMCGQVEVSATSQEGASRSGREKKDRGELSMMLGDVEWKATSARTRLKDDRLTISGSRMDGSIETTMVRQSIELNIPGYTGPGTYTVPRFSSAGLSMFLVVGLDAKAMSDAEMDEAVVKALTKSKRLMLGGTTVRIESATDEEIIGTFSLETGNPSITEGRFRALVRK